MLQIPPTLIGRKAPFRKQLSLLVVVLMSTSCGSLLAQTDSLSTAAAIQTLNHTFISPFAAGVQVSPYEIRHFHRDFTVKHIEMVDDITVFRTFHSGKADTIYCEVKNNLTIIQNPGDRFNSNTYIYHDDGRPDKMLRGRHPRDLFFYDEEGYLIQHGFGGEAKRANRTDRTFAWNNLKYDRLEYTTKFDQQDRLLTMVKEGHLFGPGMDHQEEVFEWEEEHLVAQQTIRSYVKGRADTTFVQYSYDELGILSGFKSRNDDDSYWYSTNFETQLEYLENDHVRIALFKEDEVVISMIFDHYGNWIELSRPANAVKLVLLLCVILLFDSSVVFCIYLCD